MVFTEKEVFILSVIKNAGLKGATCIEVHKESKKDKKNISLSSVYSFCVVATGFGFLEQRKEGEVCRYVYIGDIEFDEEQDDSETEDLGKMIFA